MPLPRFRCAGRYTGDRKGRPYIYISAVTNIRVPEGTKKYDISVPVERVTFD